MERLIGEESGGGVELRGRRWAALYRESAEEEAEEECVVGAGGGRLFNVEWTVVSAGNRLRAHPWKFGCQLHTSLSHLDRWSFALTMGDGIPWNAAAQKCRNSQEI